MTTLALRIAAPAALAVFALIAGFGSRQPPAVAIPLAAAIAAIGAVLAWRDADGWPLAAGVATAAVGIAVLANGQPASLGWFAICLLAGWIALDAETGPALVVAILLLGITVGQWLLQLHEAGWLAWASGVVFTLMACGFARRQHLLVEELKRAQAGLAQRATIAERNRLAGEVHDVIGHALTVSLLHISSARLALDEDPALARSSLDRAENLARASLDEVRASVGLIRDHTDGRHPLPDAADLSELVNSFRKAGAVVDLDVSGDLTSVGSARGLAVYRIVQESMTNAARHAPGEPMTVRITVESSAVTVAVTNNCAPEARTAEGSGLMSMRERVAALGGRLAVGPAGHRPEWRVEGWLPT